ncbi:MAG: glycosyltransferase family 2 protein [Candidatus Competibacteraceae bacterium]|nr:glycosyltransferase family 2 protein [Candidatus Competibacteraceae bacterium]
METLTFASQLNALTKTAVVILNWNGKDWLSRFLPTVILHSQPEAEVWVADNGSSDGSVEWLSMHHPSVHVLCLEKNWGFAGGYNRALTNIDAQYFVLLNSDVEVSEGWLTPIIQYMDQNDSVGAMQPKIKSYYQREKFEYAGGAGGYMDKWGYMFCRGRIFAETETDIGQYDDIRDIFWGSGAALFVRSNLYREAGELDEDLFAHMEEIDLCWRIQHLGYRIVYHPASCVYHVGGGTLSMGSPMKTYLNFRNNLLLLTRNLPANKLIPIIFTRLCLDGLAALSMLPGTKGIQHVIAIFKAHIQYYLRLPATLKKRRNLKIRKSLHVYNGSIVYEYYIKKRTTFNQLQSGFGK